MCFSKYSTPSPGGGAAGPFSARAMSPDGSNIRRARSFPAAVVGMGVVTLVVLTEVVQPEQGSVVAGLVARGDFHCVGSQTSWPPACGFADQKDGSRPPA